MKKLNAANEHLKKFSHVNKKALDQYVSFSDQRETILERKVEIDTAQTAIKELIDGLDLQKDEVGGMYCGTFLAGNIMNVYNFNIKTKRS